MARLDIVKQRVRAAFRALAGIDAHIVDTPTPATSPASPAVYQPSARVLDYYVTTAPSPQTALDLFKGEWASALPAPLTDTLAGSIGLFADARITWAIEQFGGVEGRSVLELGPLEGGHSYMLEQAGAAEVVAIEANGRAFLKCLIIKELLGLQRVRFLCGDFVEYLRAAPRRFDMIIASGVLYHMRNPAELIDLMARTGEQIFIWTHYYDEMIIQASPILAPKFPSRWTTEYQGFRHTLYRQEYQTALDELKFCGGSAPYSAWMTREELLACVRYFGFHDLRLAFDVPDHPHGPSLALVAVRR